jgi:hypothetical protein
MVRLEERDPCLAKGPKTTSAQISHMNRADAGNGGADQLAGLRQGPPLI